MMRESSSVRLIWSFGRGPSTGGLEGLPRGFPCSPQPSPAAPRARPRAPPVRAHGVPRSRLDFARASASLPKRSSRRASSSAIDMPSGMSAASAASALAIRSATSAFELRLDLAGVFMRRQRAVPAGVGVNLRAVQRHRPHLQNAHLPRQQQHLNEQSFDLLEKAPSECRDRVVVGMIVGRDEPERCRGHASSRSSLRLESLRPSHSHKPECPAASSGDRTPNPSRDSFRSSRQDRARRRNLHHKPRQMVLGKPFVDRGRQQKPGLAIDSHKIAHKKALM